MRYKSVLSALVVGLALSGVSTIVSAQDYKLRFAISLSNPEEPSVIEINAFADRLRERSGGRLDVQVFPGEQLGPQKKVNEMIASGAAMMSMTDYGYMGSYIPDMGVFVGPYIFKSIEQGQETFKSPLFKELAGKLEEKGIKTIVPDALFGVVNVLADRPIRTLNDINGVTIRIPPSLVIMEGFKSFGARPVELPFAETYNSLQSGVINGVAVAAPSAWGAKLHELRKFYSLTGHQITFANWVTSKKFFDSLPADLQAIFLEEGERASVNLTKRVLDGQAAILDKLRSEGVEIVEDVDTKAFREASAGIYDTLPNLTPGFMDKLRAELNK